MKPRMGSKNGSWKGGRTISVGYVRVLMPEHHRADGNGYTAEHVLVAERALGRPLEKKHPVHHHDENRSNNANGNLVICEDLKYHKLLHTRMSILRRGGNPNTDKWCPHCERLLPQARFHRDRRQPDGLNRQCKQCAIVRACLNYRRRIDQSA